jgi:hypothetical protein
MNEPEPDNKPAETKSPNSCEMVSPPETLTVMSLPAEDSTTKRKRGPYKPRKPKTPAVIDVPGALPSIPQSQVPEKSVSVDSLVGLWAMAGAAICAAFRLEPLSAVEVKTLAEATEPVAKKYASYLQYTDELVLAGTVVMVFGMRKSITQKSPAPLLTMVPPAAPELPKNPMPVEGPGFFAPGDLQPQRAI